MIDVIREWWALFVAIGGTGFLTWYVTARTQLAKLKTMASEETTRQAEEEAKQAKALAQAKTREAIEAINRGDVSKYGEMLEWMQGMLKEQAAQHEAVRQMLEETIARLRKTVDAYNEQIGGLTSQVAELSGRDLQCSRELGELRVMITQLGLTHREEQGVHIRANERLREQNRHLFNENRRLGGDPTATDIMGPRE